MKLKLSSRRDYCKCVADRIHKTNPTCDQTEKALLDIYETAYKRGYNDAILDNKKLRSDKELSLKRGMNKWREQIDDIINQKR